MSEREAQTREFSCGMCGAAPGDPCRITSGYGLMTPEELRDIEIGPRAAIYERIENSAWCYRFWFSDLAWNDTAQWPAGMRARLRATWARA